MDNKYLKLFMITIIIVALDQISKVVVSNNLALHESIQVIPGFFNLTYVHNPGGAFGFLADQGKMVRIFVFLIISIAAVCIIFYFYRNTPSTHPLLATGLALIFAGALGNLVDRIRMGTVIDFLDVYIKSIHWPAFNIADSAITIGMTIFVLHLALGKMPD